MQKITIIGFGRFGKTLYELLKDDFDITIYSRSKSENSKPTITTDLQRAYANDNIFYAVPIAAFEEVIAAHKNYFRPEHLLIDVLSVKMHPAKVFETYLAGTKTQALLTHPMFGPDSATNGVTDLPIIMDQFKADTKNYDFWKNYFTKKKLRVIEMNPKTHDKTAADSQGLTHFIGRLLEEYKFVETSIDSVGTKKLLEVKEQTCNDTWELFTNLQHYNPYTKQMRLKLGTTYDKLFNKLLPQEVKKDVLTLGIQGGEGSFNEEAALYYLHRNNITNYSIKYLHTAKNVLKYLHEGKIDQGIFAIHNSVGGIVTESIEAMAQYKFTILEEFGIKIAHALMIRKDAQLKDVISIMTHPQVLAQCKQSLQQKYPQLHKTSGEENLIDHALVAKFLSQKKLGKHIATMGSKRLAEIYKLKVVEDNLQDSSDNYTSFLLVKRI